MALICSSVRPAGLPAFLALWALSLRSDKSQFCFILPEIWGVWERSGWDGAEGMQRRDGWEGRVGQEQDERRRHTANLFQDSHPGFRLAVLWFPY